MNDKPAELPPHLHPTTRVPRVFKVWGTICYGILAIASITTIMIMDFTRWTPPWWVITSALLYVFISAGIIALGRIESNHDSKFFIQALKERSEENKRRMN